MNNKEINKLQAQVTSLVRELGKASTSEIVTELNKNNVSDSIYTKKNGSIEVGDNIKIFDRETVLAHADDRITGYYIIRITKSN